MNTKQDNEVQEKYVIPGDKIATTEEYLAGKNTTESGGDILSAVYGTVYFDEANLTVSVINSKKKISAKVGDVVYGQVTKIDRGNAVLNISAIYQTDKGLVPFNKEVVSMRKELEDVKEVLKGLIQVVMSRDGALDDDEYN